MSTVGFYTVIDPRSSDNTSGGPQTAKNIIRYIKECGYTVDVITPTLGFVDPSSYTFNVYQDVFNDPDGSPWFAHEQMNEMLHTDIPFLFSECSLTACTTAPYADLKAEGTDISPFSSQFMSKAVKFIVASPKHGIDIENWCDTTFDNIYPYLFEVDTKKFKNLSLSRNIEYLTVGTLNKYKGTDLVIAEYGDMGLKIVGYGETPAHQTKAEYLGKIPNENLPNIYNKSKNFVHFPRCKESFGIAVAEAALCGCNLIVNENVGAMSFGVDLSDPNIYKESADNFRTMIENEFGKVESLSTSYS
jgi:glycosyltransferase involved in cell wall biosynthesis